MRKPDKNNLIFPNIVLYSALITLFIMLLRWKSIPDDSKLIVLLPALFGFYMRFTIVKYFNSVFISLFFINILAFIKYVILPLLMVVNENFFVFSWMNKPDMKDAYLLMIYDLFCIILAINLFCRHLKYIEVDVISNSYSSNVVYNIAIIIGIMALIYQPAFFNKLIFFSTDYMDYEADNDMFDKGGLSLLLFYFIRFIQVLFFIIVIKKADSSKYQRNAINLIALVVAILLNCCVVWSSNRATIVTTLFLTGYTVWLVFPKKRKLIIGLLTFVGFALLVILTSFRYFNKLSIGSVKRDAVKSTFGIEGLPFMLDVYLSGPTCVAIGRETTDYYEPQITLHTFINDLFVSTNVIQPLLTKRGIDVFHTTSSYFNEYTGKDMSLIIPIVCQGRLYLGEIFSPLFGVIAIFLMFRFEIKAKSNKDIALKYVWLLLALRFAWVPGYSLPVLVRCFSKEFIPLYLIIYTNNKFSKS